MIKKDPFLNNDESGMAKVVAEMLGHLHWLGHSSFRLDASKVIYFDPQKLSSGSKEADIILVSHEHFDHFSKDDIAIISSNNTVIVCDKAVAKRLSQTGIRCKIIKAMLPEDVFDVDSVHIRAVASYNTNKQFHTKDSHKLGFIVTVDGVSIYHAGDTDHITEMATYNCDVALLPISGTYVMTAGEARDAALLINPKVAIPMHYGDTIGSQKDAFVFQNLLGDKIEVRILKKEG